MLLVLFCHIPLISLAVSSMWALCCPLLVIFISRQVLASDRVLWNSWLHVTVPGNVLWCYRVGSFPRTALVQVPRQEGTFRTHSKTSFRSHFSCSPCLPFTGQLQMYLENVPGFYRNKGITIPRDSGNVSYKKLWREELTHNTPWFTQYFKYIISFSDYPLK